MLARVTPPAWARLTAYWLPLLALQLAPCGSSIHGLSGPPPHSPTLAREGSQPDCARRESQKRNTKSVTNELTTDSYLVPPQYPTQRSITIALSPKETIGIALDIASTATTTLRPTVCGLSLFQSQPLSIVRTNTAPSTDSLPHTPTPPPNAPEHHTIYRTPPRAKILTAFLFDAYATKFLQINMEDTMSWFTPVTDPDRNPRMEGTRTLTIPTCAIANGSSRCFRPLVCLCIASAYHMAPKSI